MNPIIMAEPGDLCYNMYMEGFLLKYKHFFGNYDYYHEGYGWYEKEIRIVRNLPLWMGKRKKYNDSKT